MVRVRIGIGLPLGRFDSIKEGGRRKCKLHKALILTVTLTLTPNLTLTLGLTLIPTLALTVFRPRERTLIQPKPSPNFRPNP